MTSWKNLETLLLRRRETIADHAWRDRDADTHLAALREVSEALTAEYARLRPVLPARLQHYLTQCSYDKALAWIQDGVVADHGP
ncbi:MAG: hypothetical protein V4726_18220 [Verrucomicrobiota bacterium]